MSESNTSAISRGANVQLVGLSNAKFNGLEGICHGISGTEGRYVVEINGDDKQKLIKRENLKVLPNKAGFYTYKKGGFDVALEKSGWANGLSSNAAAEWFVDCYRMRVDDEYVWMQENRGLYNPDNTKEDVLMDFLIFCNLALYNGVIPPAFDWKLCIIAGG